MSARLAAQLGLCFAYRSRATTSKLFVALPALAAFCALRVPLGSMPSASVSLDSRLRGNDGGGERSDEESAWWEPLIHCNSRSLALLGMTGGGDRELIRRPLRAWPDDLLNKNEAGNPVSMRVSGLFRRCLGGDEGDRTLDLGIANAALSQLSYVPESRVF